MHLAEGGIVATDGRLEVSGEWRLMAREPADDPTPLVVEWLRWADNQCMGHAEQAKGAVTLVQGATLVVVRGTKVEGGIGQAAAVGSDTRAEMRVCTGGDRIGLLKLLTTMIEEPWVFQGAVKHEGTQVPEWSAEPLRIIAGDQMQPGREPSAYDVACPRCGAAIGDDCDERTLGGKEVHKARVDALNEDSES